MSVSGVAAFAETKIPFSSSCNYSSVHTDMYSPGRTRLIVNELESRVKSESFPHCVIDAREGSPDSYLEGVCRGTCEYHHRNIGDAGIMLSLGLSSKSAVNWESANQVETNGKPLCEC